MPAKYPTYPEYKDSEVEWLGSTPKHWDIKPCRAIVRNINDKNEGAKDQNYLSLMANIGVIRYEDKGDVGNKKPDDLTKCKIVRKGNLVINSMNYAIGSYGMSSFDGVCSPAYIVLDVDHKKIKQRFALRLFENKPFQKYLATFGNGILEHRAAIGWDDIKGAYAPVPPLEEQESILSFLDRETTKIDTLIEKQQLLIKLLKEKRQAVISHAVTKGLNPNAPMKDSGVEWLGDVPAHWELKKLRYLGSCQNGINIGAEYFGSGYPFISYGDVYKNEVLPKCGSGLVQSTQQDRETCSVLTGDVIFTRTSETIEEIGFSSTCLTTIKDATFAGFLIRFRPSGNNLSPDFSKYYFRSELMRVFFIKEMNLVTRASLSQDLLKKLPVPLPSIDEQKQIAAFLDQKTSIIDKLILKAEQAIELIKERRTALISAAVTGKIDVRSL